MRMKYLVPSLVVLPVMAQVSSVDFSDSKDAVPGFDSSGAVTFPAARLKVDIAYPNAKKAERCELTVEEIKAFRTVVFADATALVQFDFGDGLAAKARRGRATSLDAAASA